MIYCKTSNKVTTSSCIPAASLCNKGNCCSTLEKHIFLIATHHSVLSLWKIIPDIPPETLGLKPGHENKCLATPTEQRSNNKKGWAEVSCRKCTGRCLQVHTHQKPTQPPRAYYLFNLTQFFHPLLNKKEEKKKSKSTCRLLRAAIAVKKK